MIINVQDRDAREAVIDQFLMELQQLDQEDMKAAIRFSLGHGIGEFMVVSGFELTEQQKVRICKTIQDVFAMNVNCTLSISKPLSLGIELRASGWRFVRSAKE